MEHDITRQIEEIARLKRITPEEAFAEFNFTGCYRHWGRAYNRREENRVDRALADLTYEIREKEIRNERLTGYRWIKHPTGWVVAGDFAGKAIGDMIAVTKANGDRQEKKIVRFTNDGHAGVF